MSNKISEINIKHFTSCFFDDVMNIKNLDTKSRQMKFHTNKFLFTSLDMWQSKSKARQQLIVLIFYTLLSIKMGALMKVIEINNWN